MQPPAKPRVLLTSGKLLQLPSRPGRGSLCKGCHLTWSPNRTHASRWPLTHPSTSLPCQVQGAGAKGREVPSRCQGSGDRLRTRKCKDRKGRGHCVPPRRLRTLTCLLVRVREASGSPSLSFPPSEHPLPQRCKSTDTMALLCREAARRPRDEEGNERHLRVCAPPTGRAPISPPQHLEGLCSNSVQKIKNGEGEAGSGA